MENIVQFLLFSSSIFIFFTIPAQSVISCEPVSCDSSGLEVLFPFRLKSRQQARCGYPGFDLDCNSQNQTILNLPQSGEFIVDDIDYRGQALLIKDPGSCLANRALNFSLSGSPFQGTKLTDYMFLNCSAWLDLSDYDDNYELLSCLFSDGNIFLRSSPAAPVLPTCQRMANVSVPPWRMNPTWDSWRSRSVNENFQLVWSEPTCGKCEDWGGNCRYKHESGLKIGCSKSFGYPISVKYYTIAAGTLLVLFCMIGLVYYIYGSIKTNRHQRRPNFELRTGTVFVQQPVFRAIHGLNLPTIESYPKTVLGQSRRLPKPSDNTCSICLCEYQPKETLRSIPKCNHYFHAGCIDEWLKFNGTCPLCRNSPNRS